MDICYYTKFTVISLTHNFETFFVRHNNRHQRFLPVLCLSLRMSAYQSVVSSLVCLFKGVRFGRNCGAVSVEKYNKIQLTI